jgi:hypothetical protein
MLNLTNVKQVVFKNFGFEKVTWGAPEMSLSLLSSAISLSFQSIFVFREISRTKGRRPIRKKLSQTLKKHEITFHSSLDKRFDFA